MIPVNQTIIGGVSGNCFAACVASILELPLSDVPNFCDQTQPGNWWRKTNAWLAERGLVLIEVRIDKPEIIQPVLGAWCILSGPGPRGHCHAVVGKGAGYQGFELVHDPHPEKVFFGPGREPEWAAFFAEINPAGGRVI